ncbi:uncharacterized protein LACBIDRAFT_335833 [Laccaria bicolor S238N-H82]|uniref:Predicted protein n=1 Tax=Laccaria bicolor (strain S238N-H82 / ATCC MYA-4686) TaxID=486041 RepID=B0E3K2_LACBS|nr:uncharacterized protein LACBIDRAFT_335833 [Laccaria bicolor S238N-H82]EDQ98580.1 predicted protein [Laccaria bicolor S238N-H82]|eukprot:XP_001890769.1 predicted protein [Laccaria bicolor S238N-H82]
MNHVPFASPPSPTSSRSSLSTTPPNLASSPMRTTDTLSSPPSPKRFDKLDKWTMGHVRALEDRMNEVERWISISTQHAYLPSQEDFEEERVGHEVTLPHGRLFFCARHALPCNSPPSSISSAMKAFVYGHFGVTPPFILRTGYTTRCFVLHHLSFLTGFRYGSAAVPACSTQVRSCLCFYQPNGQPNTHTCKRTNSTARIITPEIGCWEKIDECTPRSYSRVIGGSFSVSPVGDDDDDKKEEESAGEFREGEETIGKSSGIKLKNANGSLSSTTSNSISPGGPGGGDYKFTATTSPSPSTRRIRAQNFITDSYHGDHCTTKAEVEVPLF